MPFEWWVSLVCEHFHCMPSVALREIETAPMFLLETIVMFRAYAQARRDLKAAEARGDKEAGLDPKYADVLDIEGALVEARWRAGQEAQE